ncbi:MAG: hypothetical protein AB7T06_22070 [Kofleriaceae bacterium]
MDAGGLGKALLAKVRASKPPHDDTLAAQLRFAHDQLRGNQGRVLLTVGQFAAPLVLVPAFYLSLPLFVALIGAAAVGAGRVVTRTRRRGEEVRELARNAMLGEARALPNGTNGPGIAAYETERMGNAFLRVEIRDGDGSFTARLMRERPRGFGSVDVARINVLFARESNVVIAFDSRGEMILGQVESEPLPRARVH